MDPSLDEFAKVDEILYGGIRREESDSEREESDSDIVKESIFKSVPDLFALI